MKRADLIPAVRRTLQRLPAPHDSHYGVVPTAPMEGAVIITDVQAIHSRALEALGRADAMASSNHFLMSRVLVRQEAVASSDIEGTHSTLDALLQVEETDAEAHADDDTAAWMVRDYAVALEWALGEVRERGHDAFDVEMLETLHGSLMRADREFLDKGHKPGFIRGHVVWMGGSGDIARSTLNPPPPARVSECLSDDVGYLRCEGAQVLHQSIITRMAIAHAHFLAVHPFPDGNGRVARLMLPLMMAADERVPLYLSPYISDHRPGYVEALKAAQQRLDPLPLIAHLSEAIVDSVDAAESTISKLAELDHDWDARRRWRKGSAALRLRHMLASHPIMTAQTATRLLGVTPAQARNALRDLEKVGIVQEQTGYRRNRIFRAGEVLAIFQGRTET